MLADILQFPVRKVDKPVYALSYGLDNAAFVSAAGILKYCIDVERDPYLFMESEHNKSSQSSQTMSSDRDRDRERHILFIRPGLMDHRSYTNEKQ